jgi:hypoxanthine phosphoribosyltransferase
LNKVEDIVDTGSTLSCLISHLESKGASSVSVCAFLDKPARRKVHFQLVGEGKFYRGFEVNIIKQFFFFFYSGDFLVKWRSSLSKLVIVVQFEIKNTRGIAKNKI